MTARSGTVWNRFIPGVLAMIAIFGTSMTGSDLLAEMAQGSRERMLVTTSVALVAVGRAGRQGGGPTRGAICGDPARRAAVGIRHRLRGGAGVGIALLGVFGVGLGALSYTLALAVRQQDWVFWTVQQTLMFPLLILSDTILPLDDAPTWMRVLVDVNPWAYVVDAGRSLFSGSFDVRIVGEGAIAAVAVAVVGLTVGVRAVGSATRR